MEHLDETAFNNGAASFKLAGVHNPYIDKNGIPHKEWERGWNFAYFKALRKTKAIERSRDEHGR